jgi:hypothetical protein
MNITYNNLSSPSKLVTFTNIPNILKVEEYVSGDYAIVDFSFSGDLRTTVTADSQYSITFIGETITNVMNPSQNNNKRFYISGDDESTAMNVARALRNCASINAEFNVLTSGSNITLQAKTIGAKWDNISEDLTTTIPSAYLSLSATNGTANSIFYKSKIDVNVYQGENYITTLEKNWYGDECAFNMSPLLATLSEYGETRPYTFSLDVIREDGEWQHLGEVSGNTAIGYKANMSEDYLTANTMKILACKRNLNPIKLYTYGNTIPYSILCGNSGWSAQISVKNSANVEIWTTSFTQHNYSVNLIKDDSYTIPLSYWDNAFYVDITVGTDSVRFNVIKPLKGAENFQRIFWRNEYNGISFFDFTAQKSESDNVSIETYEKNVFDYYTSTSFEKKKIYKNDYKKSVTLKSHLMDEDGKYIFNSLAKSTKVWTVVGGKTFYIIPKSIEVTEEQTYNGIFTAKLSFEYSDL